MLVTLRLALHTNVTAPPIGLTTMDSDPFDSPAEQGATIEAGPAGPGGPVWLHRISFSPVTHFFEESMMRTAPFEVL